MVRYYSDRPELLHFLTDSAHLFRRFEMGGFHNGKTENLTVISGLS